MTDEAASRFRAIHAAALAVAILAPLAIVAILVSEHYVPIPFKDDWELAPAISANSVSIRTLFHQHNEHVCFVPKLVLTTLARSTGWSMRVEPVLNLLIVLVTALALLLLAGTGRPRSPAVLLAAGFGVSVFLFSPAQYDVWLWPWMITATITTCLLCVGAWFLARPGKGFVAGLLCCVMAALSSAQGLFAWIALLPAAIWREDEQRADARRAATWLLATFASWTLYFLGYRSGGTPDTLRENLSQPFRVAEFVAAAAGAPWTRDPAAAMVIGLAQLLAFAWIATVVMRSGQVSRALALAGVAAWVVMFGGLSAGGRLQYGIETAVTSRYLASTAVLPAAFFALLAVFLQSRPARRTLTIALATTAAASVAWLSALHESLADWEAASLDRRRGALCLEMVEQTGGDPNPCIELISPMPEQTLGRVAALEEAGVRRFRRTEPVSFERADGWVGRVSPRTRFAEGKTRVEIGGLLVSDSSVSNPGLVFLDLGDGTLWCCGFSDPLTESAPSPSTGNRSSVEWKAIVPGEVIARGTRIGGWTLLREPDRLVPLTGFVEAGPTGDEGLYSASREP